MRWPVSIPPGISTESERVARTRPCPAHVGHGLSMTDPNPRQLPQGLWVTMFPSTERTVRCRLPLPPQMSQVLGDVPGEAHDP